MVSPAIVGSIIAKHGSDQEERFVRPIAAGTTKVAFAITEPDAGTNSHNISTTPTRENGKFLLSGQKTYISGVEDADRSSWSRAAATTTASSACRRSGIVDVDAPGFTRQEIPMVNQGADKQWTLFFDKVELDEDRLIGGYNGGLGAIFDGLNPERIMGAASASARRARSTRRRSTRASAGVVAPIGTHQGVAHLLSARRRSNSSWRG